MTKINKESCLISWEAQKFENFKRHRLWGISVFAIITALLAYSLFTNNFLLSVILIISGLLIFLFEKNDPKNYHFTICQTGIIANKRFYEFNEIEDFWIFYEPGPGGRKELSLKVDSYTAPYIHIPLGNEDPNKIREILLSYLPEELHKESLFDIMENII